MFLGIEIGGTKLQLGVGDGQSAELAEMVRQEIAVEHGAVGILRQIERLGSALIQKYDVQRIGVGFGGPVDVDQGRVIKSHQVRGWDNFHMANWTRKVFQLPAVVGNDCDVATLAEAQFGAGSGRQSVFFVTVGTGVGGGFVSDGKLSGRGRPAASEIGHLRPGLLADQPDQTVESLASGWGIAAAAQARMSGQITHPLLPLCQDREPGNPTDLRRKLADARDADEEFVADLLNRCEGNADQLTARLVAQAAAEGNVIAQSVLDNAIRALGWAIAQSVTLLAPEVVVVGGGVSLMGERQFFRPLRRAVAQYVFPPLADHYALEPAALGESVVVQGAVWLASHEWE